MVGINMLINKFYAIIAIEFYHCNASFGNILYYHELVAIIYIINVTFGFSVAKPLIEISKEILPYNSFSLFHPNQPQNLVFRILVFLFARLLLHLLFFVYNNYLFCAEHNLPHSLPLLTVILQS